MTSRILFLLIVALMLTGCTEEQDFNDTSGNGMEGPESEGEEITDGHEKTLVKTLLFYSEVEVVDKGQPPRIVVSKDKLDFGKLPQGMVEKKEVLIENNKNIEVVVYSHANGTISQWISFEENEHVIPPKGNFKQIVFLMVPQDALTGNYTGYVTFEVRETT